MNGRPSVISISLTMCLAMFSGTGRAQAPERLNNLVAELLRVEQLRVAPRADFTANNPRDGWLYIRIEGSPLATAGVRVTANDSVNLHFAKSPNADAMENMHHFKAGAITLALDVTADSELDSLIVRTMPETHFVRYPQEPRFPELGTFSWEWLKENVLSSVNTIAGYPQQGIDKEIREWTDTGRKFLAYAGLPHDDGLTAQKAYETWAAMPGFTDPRLSGMIADEFAGRQHPLYPAWTGGMRTLGEKMKGTGKAFYGYCGGPGMYSRPQTRALVRTMFDADFYMAWERYHHEMPTVEEGRDFMDDLLGKEMHKWRETFPGCERNLVMVLGIFATGPDLDVQPNVNYKVWMDMQMQYLATSPEFDGLFGVHWWYSGGASEELLRWESALYRHYCIEGNTELLSEAHGWTYVLPHIANPDFHDEFDGWKVDAANENSVTPGYLERYARAQGRYWHRTSEPDEPAGNSFAILNRNAERPNVVSQEIKGLMPGKLYTAQMIVADHQDIINGKSEKKALAASLRIEGAEIVPELSYSAAQVVHGFTHWQLPFENGPVCTNHFRTAFRATSPTASLVISDWTTSDVPGGDEGQQLMINYVQVQPYFEKLD